MTFLALKLIVVNGLAFVQRHWRLFLGGLLSLTAAFLVFGYCRKADAPKLTPIETVQAQQAIATQDAEAMREVLVKSDAREKVADDTAINAKAATVNAIQESKERWKDAEAEEMAAELERRANQ
jgi:hypothetical protein